MKTNLDEIFQKFDILRLYWRTVWLHKGPKPVGRLILGQRRFGRLWRRRLDLLIGQWICGNSAAATSTTALVALRFAALASQLKRFAGVELKLFD